MNLDKPKGKTEPFWATIEKFNNIQLPEVNRAWLLDDTSLTDRLTTYYEESFSISVIDQSWAVPQTSEKALLQILTGECALIRQVALCLGDNPVVFARSIIPASTLEGPLSRLTDLGNMSLGAILFETPEMMRSAFEIALIPGDHTYLPQELFQSNPVWGRRSCFSLCSKRLIVSEIFLNSFVPWTRGATRKTNKLETFHELTSN